jgi:hypothetical protein
MPLLLLHGEGPIFDFLIKAGIVVPLVFGVLLWLMWWVRKGRYLAAGPAGVVVRAVVALLSFWMLGLAAVGLGVVLNVVAAEIGGSLWPESDGGPVTILGLFLLPSVALGATACWALKGR